MTQAYWINGEQVGLTPRQELRLALEAGWSFNQAESYRRMAVMSDAAFKRFERVWAISTATEHRLTAHMTLAHWGSLRAKARAAILKLKEG